MYHSAAATDETLLECECLPCTAKEVIFVSTSKSHNVPKRNKPGSDKYVIDCSKAPRWTIPDVYGHDVVRPLYAASKLIFGAIEEHVGGQYCYSYFLQFDQLGTEVHEGPSMTL